MTDAELLDQIAITLGRPLTDAESAQATLWLAQARALIKGRLGDLAVLDQDVLAMVLVEAVANRLKQPDALSSTSKQVSVDDASVQTSASYSKSSGAIDILDWMWDLLTPATQSRGAFAVEPVFEP